MERAKAAHGDTLLGDQFFLEGQTARDLMRLPGGYVLDHGRNAYTGTGRELMKDPKVIQLYLGTLADTVE